MSLVDPIEVSDANGTSVQRFLIVGDRILRHQICKMNQLGHTKIPGQGRGVSQNCIFDPLAGAVVGIPARLV